MLGTISQCNCLLDWINFFKINFRLNVICYDTYLSFLFKVTGCLLFASSFTFTFALDAVLLFFDGNAPISS